MFLFVIPTAIFVPKAHRTVEFGWYIIHTHSQTLTWKLSCASWFMYSYIFRLPGNILLPGVTTVKHHIPSTQHKNMHKEGN